MRDYVCAVTAGVIDGTVVLDLNTQERSANGPYLTVALMPKTEKIVHSQVGAGCVYPALLTPADGVAGTHGRIRGVVHASEGRLSNAAPNHAQDRH